MGYTVIEAPDGLSAVDIYQQRGGDIDLVLLDMIMPHLSGREVLERLRLLDPDVRVIIWSGYHPDQFEHTPDELGAKAYITKPPELATLARVVAEVLAD